MPVVILVLAASALSALGQAEVERDPIAVVDTEAGSQAADAVPDTGMEPCAIPEVQDGSDSRAGGLIGVAPDGNGTTAQSRTCIALIGRRKTAQVAQTIEVSDGANGPDSGPGLSTADSASYALSLVNVRPRWERSQLQGESNGLSVFVRQAKSDAAAILANVGAREGFATTLESYTFAADEHGKPVRAVRTQLGVVNSRDGGEFGLLAIAEDGEHLSAAVRAADSGHANWRNYFEAVNSSGAPVAYIRGRDGAFIGGDVAPLEDRSHDLGAASRRYAATHTQILDLGTSRFADLPPCGSGSGAGAIAFVDDARTAPKAWGEVVEDGGGLAKTFVKCDGRAWRAF